MPQSNWAKNDALQKIFGHFGKPEDGLFNDAALTLDAIEKQEKEKPAVCAKAWGFKESLETQNCVNSTDFP